MSYYPVFNIDKYGFNASFQFFYPNVASTNNSRRHFPTVFLHFYKLLNREVWLLSNIIPLNPGDNHTISHPSISENDFGCCVYHSYENATLHLPSLLPSNLQPVTSHPGALRSLLRISPQFSGGNTALMAYEYPERMAQDPRGRFVSSQKLVPHNLDYSSYVLLLNLSVQAKSDHSSDIELSDSQQGAVTMFSNSVTVLHLDKNTRLSSSYIKLLPIYLFLSNTLSIEHTHPPIEYTLSTLWKNDTLAYLKLW